jgi:hypothetical protein
MQLVATLEEARSENVRLWAGDNQGKFEPVLAALGTSALSI